MERVNEGVPNVDSELNEMCRNIEASAGDRATAVLTDPNGAAGSDSDGRKDATLFAKVVQQCKERVYLMTLRITRNHEDAEDARQEALLKACRHLGEFEGRSQLATWISRIAINEALMSLRKRRHSKQVTVESLPEPAGTAVLFPFFPRPIEDPESSCSRVQLQTLLMNAIDGLEPAYRDVVILRAVEERSTAETARVLQVSTSTVKTRLRRARMELRNVLRANEEAKTGDRRSEKAASPRVRVQRSSVKLQGRSSRRRPGLVSRRNRAEVALAKRHELTCRHRRLGSQRGVTLGVPIPPSTQRSLRLQTGQAA
ncbi:MAG: sigma-70 family RNA polymerase sigma factor [Candidatus Acidiferrales bacterium]|jgi:RNA polymerase sigma-70 factor (ECF subfamily)